MRKYRHTGHPPRQPDGVVAIRTADVEQRIKRLPDQSLDVRMQFVFIAAQETRGRAALRGLPGKAQPGERPRLNHVALLGNQRVGDQRVTPFGKQAQQVFELRVSQFGGFFQRLSQQAINGLGQGHHLYSPSRNPQRLQDRKLLLGEGGGLGGQFHRISRTT